MTFVKFQQPAAKSINNFFDSFLNEFPQTGNTNFHSPAVNINETDNAYQLALNVPGRAKEDFKITVDKNILTVSFEKKEEKKEENKKQIKKEFSFESFKRSFSLDEKINANEISASYENGILNLSLPKKEEVKIQPKEISIQ